MGLYSHITGVDSPWLYIDGLVVEKLGIFNSKQEAIEAKNRFEQEIKDD